MTDENADEPVPAIRGRGGCCSSHRGGGVVLGLLAVWVLAGGFGTVARERIVVTGARAPLPSTPGLTAVYLTITDAGATSDELVGASTPAAHQTMLMGEHPGHGAGAMQRVAGVLIPAHGSVALGPFADDDIMLLDAGSLRLGETVTVSLTFRTLGTIAVPVRIVAPGSV